jgi:multiple sugar transport system substrate-binding protein
MSKKMWKKTAMLGLCLVMTLPILAACMNNKPSDSNQESVLRIATGYGPDDEWFRSQFTEIFEFANPNVKIEVVPLYEDNYRYRMPSPDEKPVDPMVRIKELMEGANPPDIVMLDNSQLPELVADNLLQPLDPLITKDKFDTSDIVPTVLEGLKTDGKLYALAPLFGSYALYYNKKLFNDAGVPMPNDNMTWDEVFDLAKRVTRGEGDDKVYGFSFNNYSGGRVQDSLFYEMTNYYTQPLQLTIWDDQGEKMTVDSDQWERVWKKMEEVYKGGIFPEPIDFNKQNNNQGRFNPFQYDNFLSGRVAMVISYYGYLNEIINANKHASNVDGFTPVEWDVVTIPTHPEAPGVGSNIYMNGMMGINAKAQNPDAAWKFLKFINGDDWAKLKSRSSGQLVARKSHIKPKDGLEYNVAAFYTLTPVKNQNVNMNIMRDKPYIGQVQNIGQQYFSQMLQGEKSVRDALKEWQAEGDKMLQQMKDNPNGPIDSMKPMPAF